MSNSEKLEFAEKAKEMGTTYFKKGQFQQALKKYAQITEYLQIGKLFSLAYRLQTCLAYNHSFI